MPNACNREARDTRVKLHVGPIACLLSLTLVLAAALALAQTLSVAADTGSTRVIIQYALPGSPMHVSAESPDRVWFTMPDDGLVGECLIEPDGSHTVVTHTVPSGMIPWDILYADGAVWFTSRDGAGIGRITPSSGHVAHYDAALGAPLTTVASSKSSARDSVSAPWSESGSCLDIVSGSPTTIWFTRPESNQLARLVVTDTSTYDVSYFPLPTDYGDCRPQDVAVANSTTIWLTAPGSSRIFQFSTGSERFRSVPTGASSLPWSIDVHSGTPWFTDPAGNRLASYNPTTMALVYSRALPQADSGPFDLIISEGYIWFSEWSGGRVGRLDEITWSGLSELSLAEGITPAGVAADTAGQIWIASDSTNMLLCWRSPYFNTIFVPLSFDAS